MLRYAASDNMLVDFCEKKVQGNFDLHIPENRCAYLRFSDGREGFYEAGDHSIEADRDEFHFHRYETVSMYWFNLSDHIELHLDDTVQVMEQLLKTVDPDLKLFAPVDVRVATDLTIRIDDREKLLRMLFANQNRDIRPVLDKQKLERYLERKMHYILEETINTCRQQTGTGIFNLSKISDSVEAALINDICELLESMSLELVAARIARIVPTICGMEAFQEKETEALSWYNQVQMDSFSRRSNRRTVKRTGQSRNTRGRIFNPGTAAVQAMA